MVWGLRSTRGPVSVALRGARRVEGNVTGRLSRLMLGGAGFPCMFKQAKCLSIQGKSAGTIPLGGVCGRDTHPHIHTFPLGGPLVGGSTYTHTHTHTGV